jgi:class 3 adenylate cyclase
MSGSSKDVKTEERMNTVYMDASQSPLNNVTCNNNTELFHPNENIIDNTHSDFSKTKSYNASKESDKIGTTQILFARNSTKPLSDISLINTTVKRDKPTRRPALPPVIMDFSEPKKIKMTTTFTGLKKKNTIRSTINNVENENELNNNKFKTFVKNYLEHNVELCVMVVFTIFALLGPDLKAIGLSKKYDPAFNGFFILVMVAFFLELFGSIWVKRGYVCSFFFWLDLFAAISMIMEVDWILTPIVDTAISWSLGDLENKSLVLNSKRNQKVSMTIKVLRIIRLIRIVKLYKAALVFIRNIEKKDLMEKLRKQALEREETWKQKELAMMKRREEEKKSVRRNTRLTFHKSPTIRRTRAPRESSIYGAGGSEITDESYAFHNKTITKQNSSANNNTIINVNADVDESINTRTNPILFNNAEELTKSRQDAQNKFQALINFQNKKNDLDLKYEDIPDETKISKVVSESITQKVIIIMLLLLFLSPITDDEGYSGDSVSCYVILCKFINNAYAVKGNLSPKFNEIIEISIKNRTRDDFPIINITYLNQNLYLNSLIENDIDAYRIDEVGYSYSPDGNTLVTYSNKQYTVISATINLVRTIIACGILFYMAYVLEKDAKKLILNPLEVMINVVDKVARDPVNYKTIDALNKNIKNSIEAIKNKNKVTGDNNSQEFGVDYEIKIIQFAIIRISALMAIGFGEAGGEILKENIGSHAGLNPMLQGKKINAIFGFCFIRHFADINVALQEKTMIFVNEIADIVHSSVDKFSGAANKNIGDAFLLVWKFKHLPQTEDGSCPKLDRLDKLNNYVADQALLGFLNIIKKINKSPNILSYRNNPEIRAKFGNKFKVQMGFGLHLGWGIEGAIGSFYKIDCSYLSPNVNIAARLETATGIYGVDILISGQLYDVLSPFMQEFCREIDVVALKGCETPVRLYTVDLNLNLKKGKDKNRLKSKKERRNHYAIKKSKLKHLFDKSSEDSTIGEIYCEKSSGMRAMLTSTKSGDFLDLFNEGFEYYKEGKSWEKAHLCFKKALYIEKDGPALTLLKFIEKNNKKAPDDWNGFRKMDAKS